MRTFPARFTKEGHEDAYAHDDGQVENLLKDGWTEDTSFTAPVVKPLKKRGRPKKKKSRG